MGELMRIIVFFVSRQILASDFFGSGKRSHTFALWKGKR